MPSTDIAAQAGTDRGYHHKGSMEPEQATNSNKHVTSGQQASRQCHCPDLAKGIQL